MNIYDDVFKKISFGITFDTKKYQKDAEMFGVFLTFIQLLKGHNESSLCQMDVKKMNGTKLTVDQRESSNPNYDIRESNGIQVFGSEIPNPIESFESVGKKIPEYLTESINKLNYLEPTPVQMQTIPILKNRRHSLICAPTGSGKTLAYLFPILCSIDPSKANGIKALIILPTRELATQLSMLTQSSKVKCLKVAKSAKEKVKDYSKYRMGFLYIDIIVSTPQRLIEVMNSAKKFDISRIEWLILDEGDLLLHDSQKSFKDQIAMIYNSCHSSTTRCIFSATINEEIEEWVALYLHDPITVLIGSKNSPPEVIKQELIFVGQESGKILALRNIFKMSLDPPVLVFVNCIEKAKELFNELMYDGIHVDAMHSGKSESQRKNIVTSFRTGKIWVLITTDLLSRGIDFKGIKTVFNYDVPNTPISYIHRIGRTGRAGVPGLALTFYTEKDVPQIKEILPVLKRSNAKYPEYLNTI